MADKGGVSPGGPRISESKRRRLAALEQTFAGAAAASRSSGLAQPQGGLQRPASSGSLRHSPGGGQRRSSGGRGAAAVGAAASSARASAEQQQQQQQVAEPPYNRLDSSIAQGPAAEAMQLPPPEPGSQVVASLLEQLMDTNPRAFDARAAIGLKVQDRTVMLDNPAGLKAQQGRRRSRLTAALASKWQQRQEGLYQLREAGLTYEAVQPLHRSWQQYMHELLALGGQDIEARLYAADLHGCLIRVARTPDRRYQGLRGVVVRDTANTLQLVTPDSRFVVVPKQLCTWEFDADRRRVVTLLGPGLAQRGSSGSGGAGAGGAGRPKTLREAIRGQQRQQ